LLTKATTAVARISRNGLPPGMLKGIADVFGLTWLRDRLAEAAVVRGGLLKYTVSRMA
jgi:hypothetical protein